jgi:uncharacterized surface protein with fasciclin (FAS1) repeats
MKINTLKNVQKLVILTGALTVGTLSVSPALANNQDDSMKSSSGMSGMEMNQNQSSQSNSQAANIVEVASGNENFSTLAKAIEAAGLTDKLSDSNASLTVFAPTNEAFNQLPDGTLEYLLQPENQEVLQRVLSYHVLPERVSSNEISSGEVDSLDGGLATEVTNGGIVVNNANVVNPNIQASNGVIHGINRVLLPADLQNTLASELGIDSGNIFQ